MAIGGKGLRRKEGRGKVDGSTRFTADLEMPGLAHVQLVLSHLPSARIRSIDASAARAAAGGRGGGFVVARGGIPPRRRAGGPEKAARLGPGVLRRPAGGGGHRRKRG